MRGRIVYVYFREPEHISRSSLLMAFEIDCSLRGQVSPRS